VICVDADVNRGKLRDARAYYIGTDNLKGGKTLGIAAKSLLEAKKVSEGSYVQFVGRTGSHNARERMDGFKTAVGKSFREADRMGDDMKRNKAQENVRNAIINHKDLVALVGIWSYNAPAIVDVVKEKNKRDDYVIATFDAEPNAISQMGEGMIDVMVIQNPYEMGYQSTRLLKAMMKDDQKTIQEMFPGDGSDPDCYDTGLKVVVPNAKGPLNAELFDKKTQFMSLDDFRTWLTKYKLKGS
jgi:ribose transport system substrate-binding protein